MWLLLLNSRRTKPGAHVRAPVLKATATAVCHVGRANENLHLTFAFTDILTRRKEQLTRYNGMETSAAEPASTTLVPNAGKPREDESCR